MASAKSRYWIALILVVVCVPLFVKSNYVLSILIVIGLYAIIVQGLGLLMGYAGQVSFGQAAFYGLGAYTAAILATKCDWPPVLCVLVAPFLPALVALIIGRPILRLREHYLVLATLGFGILAFAAFNESIALTGGPSGLTGIPYLSIGPLVLDNDRSYYYVVWGVLGLVILAVANLTCSPIGRAFKAIHASEQAAQSAGIDTALLKLQAFVFSAFLAGLAGGLYAFWVTFVGPSPFGFTASIEFVLMAVVGGLGTLWGPVLGSAIIVGLAEFLRWGVPILLPKVGGEFEIVFFGIIFVLIMLLRPQGILAPGRPSGMSGVAVKEEKCSG
ncbi:MAG: branched-chain amino acid ABC transporter permease [Eubacteriales bacterium]|nr:branched-chain amino acid ABC transporter permease [Bacillota bacterium]MDP3050674.1 branched-chain amino acid ABC transporter permease [Eubacteriales bacterium]MDQ7789947.1 branched-chain amino acid ABC transporter permease [Clostridia bacterium]MDZ4042956.1 branched-chain amino acid ABC transporter permease [Eubacteriales bacterium]MDZ7610295.1 branched-chain amino acid ABC transporter permease [Eubacteriales bacterium]